MKRFQVTVENAGRVALVIAFGAMAGLLAFLLWAATEHGAQ